MFTLLEAMSHSQLHAAIWQRSGLSTAEMQNVACQCCNQNDKCLSCCCSTYALAIAHLLDPTGELFQGRVIAQGAEDGSAPVSPSKRLMQVPRLALSVMYIHAYRISVLRGAGNCLLPERMLFWQVTSR